MEFPFEPLTKLEAEIVADPEFRQGAEHGRPRPGHPEGAVKWHIAEVLQNIDRWYAGTDLYFDLRLIALVHDTFKFQVQPHRPKTGENHHGFYARTFASRFLDIPSLLDVIELHDEAYHAWCNLARDNRREQAIVRIGKLIARTGPALGLYLAFFRCDNATGDKDPEPYRWFCRQIAVNDQTVES